MSHIVNLKIELRNKQAILNACLRLQWTVKENSTVSFFSNTVTGTAIYIPGWRYPAVITTNGTVAIDTYNGNWGNPDKLNILKQAYGIEMAKAIVRQQGKSVYEQHNQDGSITLCILDSGLEEKRIEMIVMPDGNIKMKTMGFIGKECKDAVKELTKSLGLTTSEILNAEYYNQSGIQSACQEIQIEHKIR